MSDILTNLDKVSSRLSEESFLTNKGLSNEVGIHVFCYDPKDELIVREHFDNLKKNYAEWKIDENLQFGQFSSISFD